MRKLEGVIKEIVDEMNYLKKREERFSSTNGAFLPFLSYSKWLMCLFATRVNERPCAEFWLLHFRRPGRLRSVADLPLEIIFQEEISH